MYYSDLKIQFFDLITQKYTIYLSFIFFWRIHLEIINIINIMNIMKNQDNQYLNIHI
jgi:hypothetical protein